MQFKTGKTAISKDNKNTINGAVILANETYFFQKKIPKKHERPSTDKTGLVAKTNPEKTYIALPPLKPENIG